MIHRKEDVINEYLKRQNLRKNANKSFRYFLKYMIEEFFTEYKFETYMGQLADRCEALVFKQKLVRDIRLILNDIYLSQIKLGQLANYNGCKTKLYGAILAIWTASIADKKSILLKKSRQLATYDDKIFKTPKEKSLKYIMKEINHICDTAVLKLAISLPPGAGKTLITSMLSIWVMGIEDNYINGSVMRNSYSSDMAETMSRAVRDFIDSENYGYIFPNVRLAKNRKNVKGWSVEGATELTYFGSGPGGSVSGKRAKTLAVYDDFCKGMKEALSVAELNESWLFYTSVHTKRMISGTAELIIGTRYVKNDLIGRVLDKQSDLWEVIKVPALKIVKDEEGEDVEKSFCEEIRTTQEYLFDREMTDEAVWRAVSMQEPISNEGLLFPSEELNYFGMHELHDINYKIGFCDTADEGVDYLAAIILASRKPIYRKYEWEELIKKYPVIKDWNKEWFTVSEYGEVFVDIKKLPKVDARVPTELKLILFSKFRMVSNFYLVDVVFSQKGVGYTTPEVANLIANHNPNSFLFESNKEGKSYAIEVGALIKDKCYTTIDWKHQQTNKETRIMNSAPRIKKYIYFRNDYKPGSDYAKFMEVLTEMIRLQKNKLDDPGDVLSMAADSIFDMSTTFFDVLDTSEKAIEQKPMQVLKIEEKQYTIYNSIKHRKSVAVLRLEYNDYLRDYMLTLRNTFEHDSESLRYLNEEIDRLDLKFYGYRKDA